MIKMLVITCFLWSVLACAYPQYYNENSTLCPCGCSNCYDNLNCRSCYYTLGITPWRTCVSCVKSYCASCSYSFTYTNICTRCYFNYGLDSLFPPSCLVCSTSTASECASVNNCTLAGTCLNCFQAYVVKDGICRMCNQIYQRCSYCNSVQCLTCNNYYYLNYSSSCKYEFIKPKNVCHAVRFHIVANAPMGQAVMNASLDTICKQVGVSNVFFLVLLVIPA